MYIPVHRLPVKRSPGYVHLSMPERTLPIMFPSKILRPTLPTLRIGGLLSGPSYLVNTTFRYGILLSAKSKQHTQSYFVDVLTFWRSDVLETAVALLLGYRHHPRQRSSMLSTMLASVFFGPIRLCFCIALTNLLSIPFVSNVHRLYRHSKKNNVDPNTTTI